IPMAEHCWNCTDTIGRARRPRNDRSGDDPETNGVPPILNSESTGSDSISGSWLPTDAHAIAISVEHDAPPRLLSVEFLDDRLQSSRRIDSRLRWERVIDAIGPAVFLEGVQDAFLGVGGDAVAFDEVAGVPEFAELLFPFGLRRRGRRSRRGGKGL